MQASVNSVMQKAFVKEDDNATIVCPQCSAARTLSVSQFRHRQHLLKVKCKCGYVFKAQLEFRRHIRKRTDLSGNYSFTPKEMDGTGIKIVNLSLSGASFETRTLHDMQIGQKGYLVFTLDNRKQTIIKKQVVIRTVQNRRIGCEFISDRAFEKDLGFYLRS